ncbi:DUF6124 family protein [Pseudomonas typographi]|uniref:DUF6124 family protein n=1 Tax=Pseudomonas typographi TaxID=2715964 RepID=UPI003B8A7584
MICDAEELLRCAQATAYESADNLLGNPRDHAVAVVHLIELARRKLDDALQAQAQHPSPQAFVGG